MLAQTQLHTNESQQGAHPNTANVLQIRDVKSKKATYHDTKMQDLLLWAVPLEPLSNPAGMQNCWLAGTDLIVSPRASPSRGAINPSR